MSEMPEWWHLAKEDISNVSWLPKSLEALRIAVEALFEANACLEAVAPNDPATEVLTKQ